MHYLSYFQTLFKQTLNEMNENTQLFYINDKINMFCIISKGNCILSTKINI